MSSQEVSNLALAPSTLSLLVYIGIEMEKKASSLESSPIESTCLRWRTVCSPWSQVKGPWESPLYRLEMLAKRAMGHVIPADTPPLCGSAGVYWAWRAWCVPWSLEQWGRRVPPLSLEILAGRRLNRVAHTSRETWMVVQCQGKKRTFFSSIHWGFGRYWRLLGRKHKA